MVVDPDMDEQAELEKLLTGLYAPESVRCFADPLLALKYAASNPVDELYTATAMKRLGGFELGKILRSFHPDIKLHFVTDDSRERVDAMRLLAESCILRPVTAENIRLAESEEW